MPKVDVFSYFDYHLFLAEEYRARKADDPAFSHRTFLETAGIGGSMYLQRVMTRQRRLSAKYVENFVAALGISGKAAAYFRLLVRYGNEKKPTAREAVLKEMLSLRGADEHKVENRRLRYFRKWYYPVIRELATIIDFGKDYSLLANATVPKISPVQARYAVKYLLDNGFLKKNGNGTYSQTDPVVTTGPEVNSTILAGFHRKNLELAAQAVDDVPVADRDVSSLTLGVSKENYDRIKREVQQFRKRLLSIARSEQKSDMVCHVGFQLLPRSRVPQKRGSNEA